jgi:1L-myo-inositol 1-phosphate cytidylyltransferase
MSTNVALILAAGNGSRLRNVSGTLPKPLVPFNGRPLLEHILLGARDAGIERFVIVVGYRGDVIRSWVAARHFRSMQIDLVENSEYNKSNGISVLRGGETIYQNFLLLMSDHIFEAETAAALLRQRVEEDGTILAVDRKLESVFDMDDATKVRCIGDYIIDIGKELTRYDAVDTGMFLCTPAIFSALEQATVNGNCSLSDGMRVLAAKRKLRALDIGDALWQDVDTPEALAFGSTTFGEAYEPNQILIEGARV